MEPLDFFQDAYQTVRHALNSLAAHSAESYAHSIRVGLPAIELGHREGLLAADIELLARAVLLHDVGKRHIPLRVLEKAGSLTPHERRIMQWHSRLGFLEAAEILKTQ